VLMGWVAGVEHDAIVIEPSPAHLTSSLKAGDGLVVDAADWRSPEEREEGGRVYEVTRLKDGHLRLSFASGAIDFSRVRQGDWVWRSHDPELDKLARPYLNPATPVQKQPVQVTVTAHVGARLSMEWSIEKPGRMPLIVRVESERAVQASQKHPITVNFLREQLGRLGNTPYVLTEVRATLEGDPFVPVSLLNELRRRAVAQLEALQSEPPAVKINDAAATLKSAKAAALPFLPEMSSVASSCLHLLVRTPEQLDAAIEVGPDSITLDYLDLYGLRPAVDRVQAAGIAARVASPRVLKPDEQRIVSFLLGLNCGILVRSAGLLQALTAARTEAALALGGDFSLNASNVLTAQAFLKFGLQRLTPTQDLNAAQIADLARTIGADRIEAIAYQHLPVFHTEHCVFCRFLSVGTSYEDCGHPCEKHRVALRDAEGRAHPVMADVGCRNTVFGAEAQQASEHLGTWLKAGIRHYRLEFVHESADDVIHIAGAFTESLKGSLSSAELKKRLKRCSPQGITEGSLFVAEGYLEIPSLR